MVPVCAVREQRGRTTRVLVVVENAVRCLTASGEGDHMSRRSLFLSLVPSHRIDFHQSLCFRQSFGARILLFGDPSLEDGKMFLSVATKLL